MKTWFDMILETYPSDTANFLKNQKNQFTNPVGHTIYQGVEGLIGELIGEMDPGNVSSYLDAIIRVRAIQDFTPSQAVGFIFLLKKVIRDQLGEVVREHGLFEELLMLESRIDALVKGAFDIYAECREQLHDLRAQELKNRTFRLVEMVNRSQRVQDGS